FASGDVRTRRFVAWWGLECTWRIGAESSANSGEGSVRGDDCGAMVGFAKAHPTLQTAMKTVGWGERSEPHRTSHHDRLTTAFSYRPSPMLPSEKILCFEIQS